MAFIGAYGFATRGGEADEIEFAPFFELVSGKFFFTGNPIITAQVGDHRETDSLGFENGWRVEYDFAKHWGIGVEIFGEIEDLSNSGSFEDQPHASVRLYSSAPTTRTMTRLARQLRRMSQKPSEMEFTLNVGVQFGLRASLRTIRENRLK